MLTGSYSCSVDAKGRVNFPAKHREQLMPKFLIAPWLDECLIAVSEELFKEMVDSYVQQQPIKGRNIKRMLYSNAVTVEPDKQGRLVIPQALRDYAKVNDDVTVIGVGEYAEIWSSEKWNQQKQVINQNDMATILEQMGL